MATQCGPGYLRSGAPLIELAPYKARKAAHKPCFRALVDRPEGWVSWPPTTGARLPGMSPTPSFTPYTSLAEWYNFGGLSSHPGEAGCETRVNGLTSPVMIARQVRRRVARGGRHRPDSRPFSQVIRRQSGAGPGRSCKHDQAVEEEPRPSKRKRTPGMSSRLLQTSFG